MDTESGKIEPKTDAQIRTILQQEGVEFLPKRQLLLPKEPLKNIFGNESSGVRNIIVNPLLSFLKGEPMSDHFGANHDDRREWRLRLSAHGDDVYSFYQGRNQLRRNNLTGVYNAFQTLEEYLKSSHPDLADIVGKKKKQLFEMIKGENSSEDYNNMTDEEKLQVVQAFEDTVLETLKLSVN